MPVETHERVFDVDELLESAYKCELIDEISISILCDKLKEILREESNVCSVDSPVTLVGDIHGQFYDVLELFKIAGRAPDTNFLFLGDYVDRGSHSVETITLLCALKLRYPKRVILLRGNHESRQITQVYGFYQECMRKYQNSNVWFSFTDMFDYLPIASIIDNEYLAIHGGLSPSIHTLDQVRLLNRFSEIPHEGPLADLLWSDPEECINGFMTSPRGAGYIFGRDVAEKFLMINNISQIIRAHQLCLEGFNISLNGIVLTVWSAPNYCYRFKNEASCLEIAENGQKFFNVYSAAPFSKMNNDSIKIIDQEKLRFS